MSGLAVIYLAAARLAAAVACWLASAIVPPSMACAAEGSKANLVFISIDTLRADRLSAYGYSRDTSPFLASEMGRAASFDSVVAVSSWTLPTHATMFTGVYPRSHGAINAKSKVSRSVKLLAEILTEQGYRTIAFGGGGNVGRHYGFARGFQTFKWGESDPESGTKGFAASIAQSERELRSLKPGEPYFLFLHTFDAHCPYNPPEPYFSRYGSPGAEKIDASVCPDPKSKLKLKPSQALYLSDRYDGAIRRIDEQLAGLFAALRKRPDWENTVVLFTSDHGEEFFEFGRIGHSNTMNPLLLKVPLMFWGPGVKAGQVKAPVSQIDIFPTLMELLRLPVPEYAQGRSLVSLFGGTEVRFREFQFSELDRGRRLRSHYDRESLLVVNRDTNELRLYGDSPPKALDKPEGSAMKPRIDALDRFIRKLQPAGPAEAADPMSKEELDRLKTLGYAG